MAFLEMDFASGGSSINPTFFGDVYSLAPSTTRNETIDTTKRYIVVGALMISSTDTRPFMSSWFIDKGNLSVIHDGNDTIGLSVSGTTMTLNNINTAYVEKFIITEL